MTATIHGGDIDGAMRLAREAGFDAGEHNNWLDLSTGINPISYPVPEIPASAWHRLPSLSETKTLNQSAAQYYNVPKIENVVGASGTAIIIQILPRLFDTTEVSIVSPTYGDHAAAWTRAGANVREIETPEATNPDGITILVNPNNPDGRLYSRQILTDLAARHTDAGGWLIIDEAFGDVVSDQSAVPLVRDHNVIVLKSIGKFFGLAGLRLGFAIGPPDISAHLSAQLGPWPISGPAVTIGKDAFHNKDWQQNTREVLASKSAVLTQLLKDSNLHIRGGTSLFTLVEEDKATSLFNHLLRHKIYVRRFDYNPHWLRIGTPGMEQDFIRLREALNAR